jgi:hypothetical protein
MPKTDTAQQVADEFNSIILTVDHTSTIPGRHVVQKTVFSTETLEEAALALLKYYNQADLLASVDTISQFQAIAASQFPCLVYRTPENVQIVMALDTFNALVARSSSLLDATSFVLDTVGQVIVETEEAAGDVIPLQVLSWDEIDVALAPVAKKPARKSRASK